MMPKKEDYIAILIQKQWLGTLSEEEANALNKWKAENPRHQEFFDQITSPEYFSYSQLRFRKVRKAAIAERIQKEFPLDISEEVPGVPFVHRIHFLKTAWFRYAAAIILIITGITLYYSLFHTPQPNREVIQNAPLSIPNDILPGFNRAVLTLSDGNKVELNSAASETIADGTLSIENKNGQLIYQDRDRSVINTMTTPRGGQYQLTLPDGSKVWLNAASSITYPTAFNGEAREVSITGEVFFEVTKNARQPFIVRTYKEDIEVLGTEFNVNAYEDEPHLKTSLIAGSVKIGNQTLRPGQAMINGQVIRTDVKQDVAWKNGYFNFNGADLAVVLRQLSRWYDINIQIRNPPSKRKFSGELPRNLTLQQVIHILEVMNVQFTIENKTLIVK